MRKTKVKDEDIEIELIENWKKNHQFLGLSRYRLEGLSNEKEYRVSKVIASLRRRKIVHLLKRYYFIDKSKISEKIKMIEEKNVGSQ
jgi:hypothetical protein